MTGIVYQELLYKYNSSAALTAPIGGLMTSIRFGIGLFIYNLYRYTNFIVVKYMAFFLSHMLSLLELDLPLHIAGNNFQAPTVIIFYQFAFFSDLSPRIRTDHVCKTRALL